MPNDGCLNYTEENISFAKKKGRGGVGVNFVSLFPFQLKIDDCYDSCRMKCLLLVLAEKGMQLEISRSSI